MANVDTTVQQLITAYPLLYTNRTEVLHGILCVMGNGWSWQNGEPFTDSPLDPWTREDEWAHVEKSLGGFDGFFRARGEEVTQAEIDLNEFFRARWAERVEELAEIVETASERTHREETLDVVYPQSQYCLLMTMPDDVADDWRAECEKMRTLVKDEGWTF